MTGFSSWEGIDGSSNSYWHGNKNSSELYELKQFTRMISFIDETGCECAISGNCRSIENPVLCNCDSRIFNVTDNGILSSEKLPIYALEYGGSFTSISSIHFNIGAFVCRGKNGYYPSKSLHISYIHQLIAISMHIDL